MSATLTRRTATKGVAWAIPAITVGGAAPAVAASSPTVIYGQSDIQAISKPDNTWPDASTQHPTFVERSAMYFFKSGVDSMTVASMIYQIVLPSPNATFALINGTENAPFQMPTGPSGTDSLDGVTGYIYSFPYTGSDLPATFTDSATPPGSDPGTIGVAGTSMYIQMTGGDGIDANSPFQGRLIFTLDGATYTRTSEIGHIADAATGTTTDLVIGDNFAG